MKASRLITLAKAIGALAVLSTLMAGVPWALVTFVGWPLPSDMPTLAEIRDGLTGGTISDDLIVKGLALVCWLTWLQIALSTVAESLAWTRGRVAARVPLGGVVQPIVRQLVVSVLLLFGTLRSGPVTALLAHPAPASTAVTPTPPAVSSPASEATVASSAASPSNTCTVRPRDSLWRLAERHLGDGMRWRELYDLNRGVMQSDGRALTDADLIQPGWILTLPPDVALAQPPTEAADVSPAPVVPSAPSSSTPAMGRDTHDSIPGETSSSVEDEIPFAPAAGGILAAGIVATLTRLRRTQQRRRQTHHSIPLPEGDARDAEGKLRRAAADVRADRLDRVLRSLASMAKGSTGVPPVEAISITGTKVEILFGGELHSDSRGPFEVTAGGRAWTLPADVPDSDLEATSGLSVAPLPALCPVGSFDDRQILLDFETPAATAIRGDGSLAEELLWAIACGLSTSEWVDDLRLLVIGDLPDGVALLDRVQVAASLTSVFDDLEATAMSLTQELHSAGYPSARDARIDGDTWTPTIVLLGRADPEMDRFLELSARLQGLGIVALNPHSGSFDRELALDDSGLRVVPPGLTIVPMTAPLPPVRLISEVLEIAAGRTIGAPLEDAAEVAGSHLSSTDVIDIRTEKVGSEPRHEPEVVVRVLGPVEITGAETPFTRRRAEEVVVYLALHPRGVDEGRLRTALWPDEQPKPGTFNQAVSRARSCLGRSKSGELHLPHLAAGGLYRVAATVCTDLGMLSAALVAARSEQTRERIGSVAKLLQLVSGLPFEGSRGYEWAHVEGIAAHIEATVSDAAHFVAEWALDHDEPKLALDAVANGLLASPGDEILYRDRMLAHDLSGNPAGIESTMAELCRFADDLDDYDSVHPATLELYHRLTRKPVGRSSRRQ